MPGIHHVTAIAGDPLKNLSFYTAISGCALSEDGQLRRSVDLPLLLR
jgi:catechol 2,3-dioxygenase-like lactoylglutathione lyase family enzyme